MNRLWPGGDPRDVTRAILAKPPYTSWNARDAATDDWLTLLLRWIGEQLDRFFTSVGHVLGANARFAPFVGALVVAAIGVLVVVVAFRLTRRWIERRPRASRVRASALPARPTRDALVASALDAMRAERWRDAAAALVHAAFVALDEFGRLRYDPSRTPGEARRALRDARFDAFAEDADVALYAAGGANRTRCDRMLSAYTELTR